MNEGKDELEDPFIDPFLLTATLVCTVLLIFGNIYFIAHYSHHADSFFGTSTAAKAVLVSFPCLPGSISIILTDLSSCRCWAT